MSDLTAQITDKLAALGATSAEVAATLTDAGFTGRKCADDACPIFNFLHAAVPSVFSVGFLVLADLGDELPTFELVTPDPVWDFISDFDRGVYPELVAP
jgi:hypothetical protein